jgi:hypothetical protein
MPWSAIKLTPGLNAELTPTALQADYAQTMLGRFKAGLFQKIGGWAKLVNFAVGGYPRAMHAWQAISGAKLLCIGTTQELGIITGGSHQVITPQTLKSDIAPNFTTTAGSNIVTVTDTNINTITNYDSVFFNTPISVDGIILSGLYAVTANVSATKFAITVAKNGLAGVAAGGAVPSFTTVSGSSNVTVTFANHGLVVGNDIVFAIAMTIGGITLLGRYIVASVTDANNFVIAVSAAAAASAGPTAMNSGNAELLYYLAIGPSAPGGAYGSGNYGAGAYGLGMLLTGQTGTAIAPADWALGNYGEDLVACPQGGGLYYWGPQSGFLTAQFMPNAPVFNNGVFVSMAQQMVIAYGSTVPASIGVYQDPMLVKWCDVSDFTNWTPTVTNQAGSFRLSSGSVIVGGAATPTCDLIWTDIDVWTMNYVGSTFVFGFVKTGANCGLIAKHGFTQLAGNVYWFARNNFFAMAGGSISPMPCSVWDVVFQDLDTANTWKCFAGSNTLHSEVLFAYPSLSGGLGICDKYAKFNISENAWDAGDLQRNCWIDQSTFGSPLACVNNGIVYQHETGFDADTSPIVSGFTTGYFFIDEGREFVFIDRIDPDFKWGNWAGAQTAILQVWVNAIDNMGDAPRIYGPFTVTAATDFISTRIRARQISVTIQSSDSGSFWRLGYLRFRYRSDGRR